MPTSPVAAPSRLIVGARLPLSRLGTELERGVPQRLAEESGRRIGPAGLLRYSVDRGPFSLSSADGQLVIETALQGRAEACSGSRCYAGCEPQATARAVVPLWLLPDYRFDRSRVSVQFTRGCKVRALGGLLSVDVTPMLRSAIAPQLERVRAQIDSQLPELRAHVERGWRQLARPRELPLAGCLLLDPVGLVQGPMVESEGVLHARFALLARPELREECGSAPAARALPPLSADPALPEEDVVVFGMAAPLARLARAFRAASNGDPRTQVTHAAVEAHGNDIVAELTIAGELCGTVALHAEPAFGEDGLLTLGKGQLAPADGERVRAAGGDPAQLARQLTELPQLAPPVALAVLRAAPAALASLFSDPELQLSAELSSLRAAGAMARGEQLVAQVEARGRLVLAPR